MGVGAGGNATDRHIALSGCFNFRDLGGYRTLEGGHLRWRRLFRADGLTKLDEVDCAALSELGLVTVIDLRTTSEVDQRGRFPTETVEVEYHHLPLTESRGRGCS
jgi:protein-tyrosine phosphatase